MVKLSGSHYRVVRQSCGLDRQSRGFNEPCRAEGTGDGKANRNPQDSAITIDEGFRYSTARAWIVSLYRSQL
jgi:hypothetical protein